MAAYSHAHEGHAVPKVTQLTVLINNSPGTLANVASTLGNAGVNILDFVGGTTGAAGYVQLIPDDVGKAKAALERGGFACSEQAVIYVEVENTPGALAALAAKLAAKNINVHSGYATTMIGDKGTSVILAVSDVDAAASIT
jgi:hypothetical protein